MSDLNRLRELAGMQEEEINEEQTEHITSGNFDGEEIIIVFYPSSNTYGINIGPRLERHIETSSEFSSVEAAKMHVEMELNNDVDWELEESQLSEDSPGMYELVGSGYDVNQKTIGGDFEEDEFEDVVATFDSEQAAKAYAEKYRLKSPRRRSFSAPLVFHNKSLLANYTGYEIRKQSQDQYPHNPS